MGDTPEHLKSTRFQPGHAPTPGAGRPRKRPLTDRYREMLESPFPKDLCKKLGLPTGSTWGEAISEVHFRTALRSTESGNAARKEIADRLEGKSPVRFELHHEEQYEIKIVWDKPVQRRIEEKAIEAPIDVKQLPPGEVEADDDSPPASE